MTIDDVIQKWLNHPNVPADMKNKIRAMSDEMKANAFASGDLVFGTAGVRAVMGPGPQLLNEFVYQQLAYGYAVYLMQKYANKKIKVLIAHDNRQNGVKFSEVVARTLTSFDINVVLFKANTLAPTPLVSYAVRKLDLQGAVNITASHNPKEYNGFKVYDERGVQLLPADSKAIVANMPSSDEILDLKVQPKLSNISYLNDEIINQYFQDIANNLIMTDPQQVKPIKVIFTGMHGTTSQLLPQLLNKLGYVNIIPVIEQCNIDSDFTFANVINPEFPEAFNLALKYAEKYASDTIIALDPDGDRFALAVRLKSGDWHYFTGNEMGIIYAYYTLLKRPTTNPYVVTSYVSTNLVDRILASYHGQVFRTKTGFKWIGDKIDELSQKMDFVVGFEEAIGALNSLINRDKDGLQSAAWALEIISFAQTQSLNLHELLYQVIMPKYGFVYNSSTTFNIDADDWRTTAQVCLDTVRNFDQPKIANFNIKKITWNEEGDCLEWMLDGDSWIRFRISGTEPKFKVYCNLCGKSYDELAIEAATCLETIKECLGVK